MCTFGSMREIELDQNRYIIFTTRNPGFGESCVDPEMPLKFSLESFLGTTEFSPNPFVSFLCIFCCLFTGSILP